MNKKWIGILLVALLAGSVLVLKHVSRQTLAASPQPTDTPQALMLADMSEAGGKDNCALIIHAVQVARARGIRVAQFNPGDRSELLTRYHIVITPTVLILKVDGSVSGRFEGESPSVVSAIESALSQLHPPG